MKRLLVSLCLLSLIAIVSTDAANKPAKNPAFSSDTVIWAGLDYSKVRMIGPGQFNDGDAIFPGMLQAWNDLFLRERLRFVEKETKKRVVVDIGGVSEANKAATSKQIITSPGPDDIVEKSHITEQEIAKAVKSYKLDNKSGLAVVFIVDRFVKVTKAQGALYVVAFDVASRDVLFSQREIHNGTGFGFRNYWFRVVKDSEPALRNLR